MGGTGSTTPPRRFLGELSYVSLVAALNFVAVTMARPLVPLYMAHRGYPSSLIGLAVAAYALVPLALAIPAGSLAGALGPRWLLVGGAVGGAVAYGLMAFSPPVWVLVLTQILAGTAQLTFVLATQSQVAALSERQGHHERNFAIFSSYVSGGQLLGPLLGGFLADLAGYPVAFAAAALCSLTALPLLPAVRSPARRRRPEIPARLFGDLGQVRRVFRYETVRLSLTATFSVVLILAIRQAFFPLYLQAIGFSAMAVGFLLSVRALVSLGVRMLVPALIRIAGGRFQLLLGASLLAAISIGSTPFLRGFWALVANGVLVGASAGLIPPLSLAVLTRAAPAEEHGLLLGLRLTANRLAQLVSPLLFGFVADAGGLGAPFLAGGALLLSAGLSLLRWRSVMADWEGQGAQAGRGEPVPAGRTGRTPGSARRGRPGTPGCPT